MRTFILFLCVVVGIAQAQTKAEIEAYKGKFPGRFPGFFDNRFLTHPSSPHFANNRFFPHPNSPHFASNRFLTHPNSLNYANNRFFTHPNSPHFRDSINFRNSPHYRNLSPERIQELFGNRPFQYRNFGPQVQLLRSESHGPDFDGTYAFNFLSEDGISRTEQGRLKDPITYEVTGSYSYTSPEGTPVQVSYIADEFGFRADSSTNSIPGGPAAPAHAVAQVRAAQEELARKGQVFGSTVTKDTK